MKAELLKEVNPDEEIYRIPPNYYIHVLDKNKNTRRIEIGPNIYIRMNNEIVLMNPTKMIILPPDYYCIVRNPVVLD